MPPVLQDHDLTLLPLETGHATNFLALVNEPSISTRINMPIPFTMDDFEKQLEFSQKPNCYIWMISYQNTICGTINTGDTRNVKIYQGGYWISPEFRGKNIAARALMLVKHFLFKQCDAIRIQAVVEPDNTSSIRVMEKCGYHREGLLQKFYPKLNGNIIDVYMYATIQHEATHG